MAKMLANGDQTPGDLILKGPYYAQISYGMHHRAVDKNALEIKKTHKLAKCKKINEGAELWDWQQNLLEELQKDADPRKIIWYHDPRGGHGKSFFSKYLYSVWGPKEVCLPQCLSSSSFLFKVFSHLLNAVSLCVSCQSLSLSVSVCLSISLSLSLSLAVCLSLSVRPRCCI